MAHATVSITVDGVTYPAAYELKRGVVTMRTDIGTKAASVGNIPADRDPSDIIPSERVADLDRFPSPGSGITHV